MPEQPVGTVVHYFKGPSVAVVRVTAGELAVGDQDARSLEVVHHRPHELLGHRVLLAAFRVSLYGPVCQAATWRYAASGPGAGAGRVAVRMSCCCFSPRTIAASSRSRSLAYTAATALPELHSRTQ